MLTPRKIQILDSIIKHYVEYGEPISSKLIANEIGMSSATIRNDMAELTEQGFLKQPHTSAGRVPSGSAFRVYIKTKEDEEFLDSSRKAYFDSMLSSFDTDELLNKATEALSQNYACVTTTPGDYNSKIKAVQFVQISRRTAMLILLSSSGTTKSRMFKCDFDLNQEMLRVFFRAFNEQLMGRSLFEITPAFLQRFSVSLSNMSALMTSAIIALYEAIEETAKTSLIVKGQTNLFVQEAFSFQSFLAFSELINSPDNFRNALMERQSKTTIILGGEPIFPQFTDAGIISTKYSISGKDAGVFAVIGPLRMDYPKLIGELKYVANYVGKSLTNFMSEEI